MSLFQFQENQVLTPHMLKEELADLNQILKDHQINTFEIPNAKPMSYVRDDDVRPSEEEAQDQFMVFQIADSLDQPAILHASQVIPTIIGSPDEPDVLMNLEMQSFHLGNNEDISKNSRATMRINIGKDENSRDKYFDAAFWSIAVGLKFYDDIKKEPTKPEDLKSNFRKAFGNRPIEIPGGLGKMTFEVVKHREPRWWQRIFQFLQSDSGKTMTSTLGFPAIANQSIKLLDELLNKLTNSDPKVLFKSKPLRMGLSELAKSDYTSGNPRIMLECLNPGFCVLARGRDFNKFVHNDIMYHPNFGVVPSNVSHAELVQGDYDDPFRDVTYSVFRIGMKQTKLDPTFNYQ